MGCSSWVRDKQHYSLRISIFLISIVLFGFMCFIVFFDGCFGVLNDGWIA